MVTFTLCAYQLSLFAWRPDPPPSTMGQAERVKRTPDQIVRSVIAYCEWRAGEPWRNVAIATLRNDQERWDYLDAVKILHRVRYTEPPKFGPVSVAPAALTPPQVREYMTWPRGQLVAELLRTDPAYSDAKLLSRLSINKLARMLADAVETQRRFA